MSEYLDPVGLYHLVHPSEWATYQVTGSISPPSLATEGFIHCSWGAQVAGTLERHFPGYAPVLALLLDADAIDSPLVVEDTTGGGAEFPHVYGTIPVAAVRAVIEVAPAGG